MIVFTRQIIATVIFLVITIVLSILSIVAALDRSGSTYLWFARIWGKLFLWLYGTELSVRGEKNIDTSGHYVYVSNHSSYTDIPILFAAIPQDLRLILRHTLTRVPIWGWALYLSPMIIINRSNASKAKKTLAQASEIIRRGASVLLFPEGTRTTNGEMQSFKRGAFHLAYESDAKVIPVAINGSFEFMPRTAILPSVNKKIIVLIGTPLEIDKSITSDREREMDLMHRAESSVRAMLQ